MIFSSQTNKRIKHVASNPQSVIVLSHDIGYKALVTYAPIGYVLVGGFFFYNNRCWIFTIWAFVFFYYLVSNVFEAVIFICHKLASTVKIATFHSNGFFPSFYDVLHFKQISNKRLSVLLFVDVFYWTGSYSALHLVVVANLVIILSILHLTPTTICVHLSICWKHDLKEITGRVVENFYERNDITFYSVFFYVVVKSYIWRVSPYFKMIVYATSLILSPSFYPII